VARQEQDWLSFGWVLSYPLLAVLAAMIYLSAEEIGQPVRPAVRTAPVVADSPEWAAGFGARVEALHEQVRGLVVVPLDATIASEDAQGASAIRWKHRLVEATVDPQRRAEVEAALDSVRAADAGVSLAAEETFNGTQVLIGLDGLLTHTVRIVWSDQPLRPRVALVVLALGDDLRLAREIIELEAPIAVAVLPFRPFSAQVAELAKMFEREVLLHWSDAAEERGLEAALATVPGAIGVALPEAAGVRAAALRGRGPLVIVAAGADGASGPVVAALPLGGDAAAAFESLTRRAQSGGRAIGLASGVGGAELERVRGMLAKWSEEKVDVVAVSQLFGAGAG
jgi:hypothetical protein